jgi:arylsulfatase A-like enzyme
VKIQGETTRVRSVALASAVGRASSSGPRDPDAPAQTGRSAPGWAEPIAPAWPTFRLRARLATVENAVELVRARSGSQFAALDGSLVCALHILWGGIMAAKRPNILILWGDDIGMWNISHFSRGMMGYQTPNIDRVAREGVTFTDYYAQQSCTAGRACFITGQNPIRTGLTKVGMPGATVGLQKEDPTIAEMLKPLGYATGQFGKNHLGDRDEFLPTVHGFDEFFGNLYHLNAEEEPELPDYPKDPAFKKKFGPRGVLHCVADGRGGQTVTDTGPLTKKRMETIDEEITERALAWMEKQAKADQPFFLWYNSTAMHFRTHVAEKNLGKSGQDPYSDRMVVHDEQIGQMLDKLDELGISDNTIVMYSTDNGPENDTWPDGANTPFRAQKDTNWEGGWRVPCFIRWPGKIKAGSVLNGIVSHIDMMPTLLAAAGVPDITRKLLDGYTVGGKTFKVHLDGYNQIPYLTGDTNQSPRNEVFYFSDDGDLVAVRLGDYKFSFGVQRAATMKLWQEPFVKLRMPSIFNLRRDPFERADFNSNTYMDWMVDHAPQLYLVQDLVAQQIADFVKFPPRQKPASFNLDSVLEAISHHGQP